MIISILLSFWLGFPPDTVALTVDQAVQAALERNPSLEGERARARSAEQGPLAATRAFLPTIRAEAQGVRTTDPVAVFGTKLRQAAFTQSDLALDALNRPDPISGFSTSAVLELPIVAPEGLFGYAAARRGAEAGAAAASRAAGGVAFGVQRAYWEAQFAARKVEALDTALVAARAHVRQAEALRGQGLVTGLDMRLADLHASEISVWRAVAEAEAENAVSRLRALLALADSVPVRLVDPLQDAPDGKCPEPEECTFSTRGDLRALDAGARAAELQRKAAWAAQLPQVMAFGAATRHGANAPWDDGSGDWSVGVAIRWNVLPALAGVAAVRRAAADRDAARSDLDAARRQAELEVLEATRLLAAARQAVEIAERADQEARVALEQARLRYRTGVAPITELLDVQTAATNTSLGLLGARRDLFVAQAALDFAYGVNDR